MGVSRDASVFWCNGRLGAIRLRNSLRREIPIDTRCHVLIREGQCIHCPPHHGLPTRDQPAKLDLGAAAKTLFPRTIRKFHLGPQRVKPSVHSLVQDGGRNLCQ